MARYKLSPLAEDDLFQIALHGFENFGVAQSEKYRDMLSAQFEAIASNPLLYPDVSHIREGYRRSVCGVHSIYFRVENDVVIIMRVLSRQDIERSL